MNEDNLSIEMEMEMRSSWVASRIQGLLLTSSSPSLLRPFERTLLLTNAILNNVFRVSCDFVLVQARVGYTSDRSYHVRNLIYRGLRASR